MKNKTIFGGIITLIIIVAISYAHFFFKEPKPLVIFAGGGSVNKYLESKLGEQYDFPNSVHIDMPSGFVRQLLIEEIKRFGQEKEAKHPILNISLFNNKIVDWNIESLKPFLYIGLSAEKIDYDKPFDSEYAQVYEYYIGKDSLAAYYVVDKKDKYLYKDYNIDTLVKDLKSSSKDSMYIYTTTPESGTRKAYNKSISKRKDKEELMVILNSANNFFKDKTIPKNGIVLSSEYYPPIIDNKKDMVKYILKEEVPKDLYIYFIGYKSNDNIYKPNSQVIDFLNKLYDKIHPDKKKEDYFSDDYKWKIKSSERGKTKIVLDN